MHGAVPRRSSRTTRTASAGTCGPRSWRPTANAQPERKSFYEAIAATLRGADQILIFGSGTGESSAMDQLVADLKHNHQDVAKHIVGSIVIDAHHTTEAQLLAQAT